MSVLLRFLDIYDMFPFLLSLTWFWHGRWEESLLCIPGGVLGAGTGRYEFDERRVYTLDVLEIWDGDGNVRIPWAQALLFV